MQLKALTSLPQLFVSSMNGWHTVSIHAPSYAVSMGLAAVDLGGCHQLPMVGKSRIARAYTSKTHVLQGDRDEVSPDGDHGWMLC